MMRAADGYVHHVAKVDAAAKGSAFIAAEIETVSPACPEPLHSDTTQANQRNSRRRRKAKQALRSPMTRSFPLTLELHGRMALRDTWHRTLVYFGLAEEEDPRYEAIPDHEPEAELEDRYRDRPNVRRLQRRRRDEFDDIFADEPRGRETRALR